MAEPPATAEQPPARLPVLRLLRGPFGWLYASNLAHSIGQELRLLAQSWLILELGGSQLWVGAANGLRIIPFIILSLIAGLMVDRVGGRVILLWNRMVLLILAAATASIVVLDIAQVWHVVVLSLAAGSMIALGAPSMNTLVVELVANDRLQSANSMNSLSYSIGRALGPLAGGLLIAVAGLAAPWLGLALLYVVALYCTLRLPRSAPRASDGTSAWARLSAGVRYIGANRVVSRAMVLAFTVIVGITVMPVLPIYARDRFNVGSGGFGLMMGVFAAGQALSALYVANRTAWRRLSTPVLYGATAWAAMMIVFAFSRSFVLALAALFVMGTAIPPWSTSLMTLLQSRCDRPMLGRVMAVYSLSLQVGMFGWFVGGWLGQVMGNQWMLLVTGVLFAVLHYVLVLGSRAMRSA